jgi:hypothetical protein
MTIIISLYPPPGHRDIGHPLGHPFTGPSRSPPYYYRDLPLLMLSRLFMHLSVVFFLLLLRFFASVLLVYKRSPGSHQTPESEANDEEGTMISYRWRRPSFGSFGRNRMYKMKNRQYSVSSFNPAGFLPCRFIAHLTKVTLPIKMRAQPLLLM